MVPILSEAEAAAEAYAKRLMEYDRNSAAWPMVIDDQSDYYKIEVYSWLSKELFSSPVQQMLFFSALLIVGLINPSFLP